MTITAASSEPRRVPWRLRVTAPTIRTWLLYVPLCVVTSAMAVSTWDVRAHGEGVVSAASGQAVLLWLVGLAAIGMLGWRRRYPTGVALGTALIGLLLPLDPTPALVAFGSMAVRRFDRVTAMVGGLTLMATAVSTWHDGQGWSRTTSFWHLIFNNQRDPETVYDPLSWWVVLVIACMCFAITLAIALIARDGLQRRQRLDVERTQRGIVASLNEELARQAERERLAQEVHDALGHRLSLLSLHAGALEVVASDDPRTAESAALVRSNAQQSMADLRQLLAVMRQPDAPDVAAAVPTLDEVGRLVDETLSTGTHVVSTIQLDGVSSLEQSTSRSAFRIAQELLTNARRHAPGIGLRVRVLAAPNSGVEIEVANHLVASNEGSTGGVVTRDIEPGGGLRGISARVDHLGGQWRCWIDDQGVFRAAAHLPWVWSTQVGIDQARPPGEVDKCGPAGRRGTDHRQASTGPALVDSRVGLTKAQG